MNADKHTTLLFFISMFKGWQRAAADAMGYFPYMD
jgi:hypothetical protein